MIGSKTAAPPIPPMEIFVSNKYKQYEPIPDLSQERIDNIIKCNTFGNGYTRKASYITMFGFISMINHGKGQNVRNTYIEPCLNIMYADRDIRKGEEIIIDYLKPGDEGERKEILENVWGI